MYLMEDSSTYLCESSYVKYLVLRIGNALNKDPLRLLVDRSSKCFGSRFLNPLDANTKVLESDCEKVVSDRIAALED